MLNRLLETPNHEYAIDVKSVGVRWFHPSGFQVDRPHGLSDYTFVQWLTPTHLLIHGKEYQEPPGGCIVYRPNDPQWYSGDAFTPFGNNWFHFGGTGAAELLADCRVPLNRPFYLRNDTFIESILQLLLWESMNERFAWKRVLSAHAELFFIEVARVLRQDSIRRRSARNMEMQGKFADFREKLKEKCTEPWTLALMARELHLSTSQFSRLYREYFETKPIDDLVGMRIHLAEYYLRTTSLPISMIASMSGFSDVYYFSRTFKAKTGNTATVYRNLYHAGEPD